MDDDRWQSLATREAAMAIGQWLEGRGRLHQPIAALTRGELECLAVAAISRFVVLATERIKAEPDAHPDLVRLLLG